VIATSSVVAFTDSEHLMIDADRQTKERVPKWTREYSRAYNLGNALITLSSDESQLDLDGNKLYNFTIVFGKRLPWTEIMFHIHNAARDGITNKVFVKMRFQGFISERVTAKSREKSYPTIFRYIHNSDKKEDREGITEYLRWWKWNRDMNPYLSVYEMSRHSKKEREDNDRKGLKALDDRDEPETKDWIRHGLVPKKEVDSK
jgi:hypothetical protein